LKPSRGAGGYRMGSNRRLPPVTPGVKGSAADPGPFVSTMSETPSRYRGSMRCRRCRECQRVFRPSSRHIRCPSCRSRDTCECGRSKQVKSVTCGVCRSNSEMANGNWRGGRTRHKAGYVMVRAPEHPRAVSGPYVSSTFLWRRSYWVRICWTGRTCTIATACETTTGLRTWSSGRIHSRQAFESATPSRGHTTSLNDTKALAHLQQPSRFPLRTLGGGGIRRGSGEFVAIEVRR
jgi:Zn ribbon nucleic-acid-binding protein